MEDIIGNISLKNIFSANAETACRVKNIYVEKKMNRNFLINM
jgi:hypothetical protein